MSKTKNFPRQQLPFNRKTVKWRKECVDWADDKTYTGSNLVRKTVRSKQINYDLVNGKLHMEDLMRFINPEDLDASYIPEKIPHFPIINSKLNVLRGEEKQRVFDYRVVITNPNAISEIETSKKDQLVQTLTTLIESQVQSEEEYQQELQKISKYFTYEWQDYKEITANALLTHYRKEQDFDFIFNQGFMDGCTVGEEVYQCDIVGGEPVLTKLNTTKIRVFRSGYSNRIEDADIIILEDYWSPGKVIDTYYEVLSPKDRKYIEELPNNIASNDVDEMGNYDERKGLVSMHMVSDVFGEDPEDISSIFNYAERDSLMPYDLEGNLRVLRVYWKSRRKIKKVKFYNPQTGEAEYKIMPETYITDTDAGEEETVLWVNQAWEGTKIGEDIYVNMRPRPVQYNTLGNPSKCHFGIIGSVYNLNDDKPFSLVDMMKPYNYTYDVIHDRLNKLMARNWGKIIQLDLSKVPSGWDVDKWIYYAKVNGLAVYDSFKEGNYGAATGKLAGALNNNTTGIIDAEFGNSIQAQINLLEFIKMEMSEVVGITRQREGQVSNRETVGGVERATLQSSHITEYLFTIHNNTKKRVLECFIDTARIALKGKNKKFEYILPDHSSKFVEIDGDSFCNCEYGIVVDSSQDAQKLQSKIEMLAQAALQNQSLSFSTMMKIDNATSLAEKQRLIEQDEQDIIARNQQAQQEQLASQERMEQMKAELEQAKMQQEDLLNQRDNETRIIVANINAMSKESSEDGIVEPESPLERDKLRETIRQFNARLELDKERLNFDKHKADVDAELKRKQIAKQASRQSSTK